jgi:D-sedoheptulose 7-phosphate isomerase
MINVITNSIKESIRIKEEVLSNMELIGMIHMVANKMIECYRNGGKVLFCGNGGSAADAQHLAAELSGRFYYDRPPLIAEALHVNTSFLTAVANDYSYDEVFARMVRAVGNEGDILVGISTSGNSPNIIRAIEEARLKSMFSVALTGQGGGKLAKFADIFIQVPSADTPRIQEVHILIGHIICQLIESELFPRVNS